MAPFSAHPRFTPSVQSQETEGHSSQSQGDTQGPLAKCLGAHYSLFQLFIMEIPKHIEKLKDITMSTHIPSTYIQSLTFCHFVLKNVFIPYIHHTHTLTHTYFLLLYSLKLSYRHDILLPNSSVCT